jgi:hypothetical protein
MTATKQLKAGAFETARLKVKRAYEHIADLESLERARLDRHRQRLMPHIDSEGRLHTYGGSFPGQWRCPLVFGDTVHNLRAALDHLIAAIFIAAGEKPDQRYFPIDVNEKSFIGKKDFTEIKRVAPDIADLIFNGIKPYSAGNAFFRLNHLDRIDKHRLVLVVSSMAMQTVRAIKDENDLPPDVPDQFLVIGELPGKPPTPGSPADVYNKRNAQSVPSIRIGKGPPFEDEPVIPTLYQLAELVSRTIDVFEAHCFGE